MHTYTKKTKQNKNNTWNNQTKKQKKPKQLNKTKTKQTQQIFFLKELMSQISVDICRRYHAINYVSILFFQFTKCRVTLLNYPKLPCFWSFFLPVEGCFSNRTITNTFNIDMQVTYSRHQCNYIGWKHVGFALVVFRMSRNIWTERLTSESNANSHFCPVS